MKRPDIKNYGGTFVTGYRPREYADALDKYIDSLEKKVKELENVVKGFEKLKVGYRTALDDVEAILSPLDLTAAEGLTDFYISFNKLTEK